MKIVWVLSTQIFFDIFGKDEVIFITESYLEMNSEVTLTNDNTFEDGTHIRRTVSDSEVNSTIMAGNYQPKTFILKLTIFCRNC